MCKVINRVGKNVMKKIKNGRVIKVNKIWKSWLLMRIKLK
jgi:hypothetical protein